MFNLTDTIVAIATPPGRGGIGVVRVSGPSSVSIVSAHLALNQPLAPRHATLTRLVDHTSGTDGQVVDQVITTWFAAPNSYTGEDVVEIAGHGSPALLEHIVTLLVTSGARFAEPGEFTLRAYLNGRIDLVQAEAVNDLVNAVTVRQARAAMDQLDGTISGAIGEIDALLFDVIAKCEGSLDFPDEGFHFFEAGELQRVLESVARRLDDLLVTTARGRLIREGRVVAVIGRPNVGKSSLFNALLGRNRAIVTSTPGTTRDLLSEPLDINGIPVTLVDTAGIRASTDDIEREGIARAQSMVAAADLVLLLIDGSQPLTDADHQLIAETTGRRRVVAGTKADLPQGWQWDADADSFVSTSAVSGLGIDRLRNLLVFDDGGSETDMDRPAVTNIRHEKLLRTAREAIARSLQGMASGATEEMLLVDLHDARTQLELVTGTRSVDDVLNHIFANFCIGK